MAPSGDLATKFGRVIVVASLGGVRAITSVLSGLPVTYPLPIAVVQHRRRTDTPDLLAPILAQRTSLPVQVAEAGVAADQPGITVVPAQTTATIDQSGSWVLTDSPSDLRPGDALLTSSAHLAPTVAVILTGSLSDGAEGCRAVKQGGGSVLVQDPATAQAASMPESAIATGCADVVLPLERIPSALLALTTAPGGAKKLPPVSPPPWGPITS